MSTKKTATASRPKRTPRLCRIFPVGLEQAMAKAAKPAFSKRGFAQNRILTHWQEIAGLHIARHSLPTKLTFPQSKRENGCLTIKAWGGIGLELQHSEPQLLERLATYFGYRAVGRIRIVQAPVEYRP